MIFPHTRRLADMMAQEEEPEDFNSFSPEAAMHEDPRVLQLKMKRRYQTGMLKKNAGRSWVRRPCQNDDSF